MTHSHADHGGGVLEITKLLPVGAIVNHIPPTDDGEKNVAGTKKIYERFIEAGAALNDEAERVNAARFDRAYYRRFYADATTAVSHAIASKLKLSCSCSESSLLTCPLSTFNNGSRCSNKCGSRPGSCACG